MLASNDGLLIPLLVVLAVFGVGVGVLSIRRRRKIRGLSSQAAQAIEQGRNDDALRLLLAAERGWNLNSHDGSRNSIIADLDDFNRILNLVASVPSGRECVSSITRLQGLIVELRALFSERGNFGIDGRSMKKDAAVRWAELHDRFQTLREEFRKSFAPS